MSKTIWECLRLIFSNLWECVWGMGQSPHMRSPLSFLNVGPSLKLGSQHPNSFILGKTFYWPNWELVTHVNYNHNIHYHLKEKSLSLLTLWDSIWNPMVNYDVLENQIFHFVFYSIWYSFLLLTQLVMNMKIIRMNEKRINLSLNPKQNNQNKNTIVKIKNMKFAKPRYK